MGATVTNGKQVGALKTASGKIGYLLFEGTYDKRGDSREPHWECMALGYIEDVLVRIFEIAAVCEGGSLQGPSGTILPESYIAGWLKELESPFEMHDCKGTLEISKEWMATLPETDVYGEEKDLRGLFISTLRNEGHFSVADVLSTGKLEASLVNDFDVLRSLYFSNRRHVSPRRFVRTSRLHAFQNPSYGYKPAKTGGKKQVHPTMLGVGTGMDANVLVAQPDGTFRCKGRSYSLVADYVRGFGATEFKSPGSYRVAIKDYRRQTQELEAAPESIRISLVEGFENQDPRYSYTRDRVKGLVASLGKVDDVNPETTLEEVRLKAAETGESLLYHLTQSEKQVWTLPKCMTVQPDIQVDLFKDLMTA